MNDLEKKIINLDLAISDYTNKKTQVFNQRKEITEKKENIQNKLNRYSNKVKRLNEELEKIKTKKISNLTIPVLGFAGFSLAIIFSSPLAITLASTIIGASAGYRFANDIVKYKMLNEKDELLLERIFPNIEGKVIELDNASLRANNYQNKLEYLINKEQKLTEEYENLEQKIKALKNERETMINTHFKKISREYLPYYTSLDDVLNKTIENPQKFYTNVCSVLTNEERKDIVFDMQGRTCETCQNHTCRLTQEEKEKMSDCKAWYNEVEIGKSKVLRR